MRSLLLGLLLLLSGSLQAWKSIQRFRPWEHRPKIGKAYDLFSFEVSSQYKGFVELHSYEAYHDCQKSPYCPEFYYWVVIPKDSLKGMKLYPGAVLPEGSNFKFIDFKELPAADGFGTDPYYFFR